MSNENLNLDLLDMSIDDIEDLPGFEVPVNGVYSLKLNTAIKRVADKQCVEANFEVLECLEQQNPEEKPATIGNKFSMLFMLEGKEESVKISLGKLKELMAPIAAYFNEGNLLKLVSDVCKDLVIAATVKRRADKNDPDKHYASVSDVTIA